MKLTITLFLLLVSSYASSQDAQKGQPVSLEKKHEFRELIGGNQNQFFFTQFKTKGFSGTYSISRANKNLTLEKTMPLQPVHNKTKLDVEKVLLLGDKLTVLSTDTDKSKKLKTLYSQTVDQKTLTLNNDVKPIGEVEFLGFFKGGVIMTSLSEDSTKLGVYSLFPKDDQKQDIEYAVYDQAMNLLWKKKVAVPVSFNEIEGFENHLSNKGDFVLNLVMKESDKQTNQLSKVFTITESGITGEYDLSIEKGFAFGSTVYTTDQHIIISGFFQQNRKSSNINGLFFQKIDPAKKQVLKNKIIDIPYSLLTKYTTDKEAGQLLNREEKGKSAELYSYEEFVFLPKSDGGIYLIAENRKIEENKMQNAYQQYNYAMQKFDYGDIVVFNLDKNGEIDWFEKIPKKQYNTSIFNATSFTVAKFNDELQFIFNDSKENLKSWQSGSLTNFKKSPAVVLVKLDAKGNQSRKIIGNSDSMHLKKNKTIGKKLVMAGVDKDAFRFSSLLFD